MNRTPESEEEGVDTGEDPHELDTPTGTFR
jgi:hypothetical protein